VERGHGGRDALAEGSGFPAESSTVGASRFEVQAVDHDARGWREAPAAACSKRLLPQQRDAVQPVSSDAVQATTAPTRHHVRRRTVSAGSVIQRVGRNQFR
jgi:hypothetical protein